MVKRVNSAADWTAHSLQVEARVTELLGQTQDLRIGERGYVLTGLEAFLKPYQSALARIPARSSNCDRSSPTIRLRSDVSSACARRSDGGERAAGRGCPQRRHRLSSPAAIPAEATTLRTKLMGAPLDAWGSARDPYMPSSAVQRSLSNFELSLRSLDEKRRRRSIALGGNAVRAARLARRRSRPYIAALAALHGHVGV